MDGSQKFPRCINRAGEAERAHQPGTRPSAWGCLRRGPLAPGSFALFFARVLMALALSLGFAGPGHAASAPVLQMLYVTPNTASPGANFSFNVYYSDADNDAPASMKLYILDPLGVPVYPAGYNMASIPASPPNYTSPVHYQVIVNSLFDAVHDNITTGVKGQYSYYVIGSDGTTPVTYPATPLPGPQPGPRVVNNAPALSSGGVTPATGDPSTNFAFRVGFSDADNINPANMPALVTPTTPAPPELGMGATPGVYLILDDPNPGNPDPAPVPMTPLGNTWTTGVTYEVQTGLYNIVLGGGLWRYRFLAWDGIAYTYIPADGTSFLIGPDINAAPPSLTNLTITPPVGGAAAAFTFRATYTNATNAAPSYVRLRLLDPYGVPVEDPQYDYSGQPDYGVALTGYLYMRPDDPKNVDYTKGVNYSCTVVLKNTGTYRCQANAQVGAYAMYSPGPNAAAFLNGPIVALPPTLRNWSVTPGADKLANNSFTWEIYYFDPNNLPPVGGAPTVTVVDPKGQRLVAPDGKPFFRMVPEDPTDTNYTDGTKFKFTRSLETPGQYHYAFDVSNGAESVRQPILNFNDAPVVYAPPSLTLGAVYPNGATRDTNFTWTVTYTDVSLDALTSTFPTVKLYLTNPDGSSTTVDMNPPAGQGNLASGIAYTKTMMLSAPGTYKYHFGAQDGTAPLPVLPPSGDYQAPVVYTAPTLTGCQVTPTGDSLKGTFTWNATYTSIDNHPPSQGYPRLVITDPSGNPLRDAINGNVGYFTMDKVDALDNNYTDGVAYTFRRTLPVSGQYSFYVQTTDGYYPDVRFPADPAVQQPGPSVFTPPVLSNGAVSPTQDLQAKPFTWSVQYSDIDAQAPAPGYPRVVLTDPTGSVLTYPMTLDPASGGSLYTVTQVLTLPGNYTYHFEASDGYDSSRLPATGEVTGLTVDKDWSVAPQPGLASVTITPASAMVGKSVDITVAYTQADRVPAQSITLFLVGPDGQVLNSNGYPMVTTDTDASLLSSTGWTYKASFPALAAGSYGYYILATDGNKSTRLPDSGTNPGPVITPQTLTEPGVTAPQGSFAGDQFTFNVTYTYGIDRAPAWVKLVLTNPDGTVAQPIFLDADNNGSYATGKLFSKKVTLWQAGKYNYEFQASEDGTNVSVRAAGPAPAEALRPAVATLTGATVTKAGDRYVYNVVYTQPQGLQPQWVRLNIDIDSQGNAARTVDMVDTGKDASGTDLAADPLRYSKGVVFTYPDANLMQPGLHNFQVRAATSFDQISSVVITGPALDRAPTLEVRPVQPTAGDENTLFTFSAVYKDAENDAPAPSSIKVSVGNNSYEMTNAGWADPAAPDYIHGALFQVQTKLPAGSLSQTYVASDGQLTTRVPDTGVIAGPSVLPATKINATVSRSQVPLDAQTSVLASGVLEPPLADAALTANFALQVPQSDGTTKDEVRRTVSVTTDATGHFTTPEVVPDQDGNWVVSLQFAGDVSHGTGTVRAPFTVQPIQRQLTPSLSMTGLPVQPAGSLQSLLGSSQFQAAYYTGDQQSPYAYSGTAAFPALGPGLGFWLRNSVTLGATVSGRLVDHSQPFSIPVRIGWNQIASPFLLSTDWSAASFSNGVEQRSLADARQAGWLNDYAWSFDPTLSEYRLLDATAQGADRLLTPWQGAWFYSRVAGNLILAAPTSRSAKPETGRSRQRAEAGEWTVQLVAANARHRDSFNFAGVSAQGRAARQGAMQSPPLLPDHVDLYFTDPGQGSRYATDFHTPGAGEQAWNFTVETDILDQPVTVSAPNLASVPRSCDVLLEDVDAGGKRTYLRTAGGYTFNPGDSGQHHFRLIVRPRSEGALLVTNVATSATRAGTAISFTLSRDALATVDLVSPSGKVLKRVADRQAAKQGRATVLWDGTRDDGVVLGSGVYMLRINVTTSEGQSAEVVKPMITAR